MKTKLLLLLATFSLPALALEEGFASLFNGKDLTGWKKVNGNGQYKIDGDCIVGFGKNIEHNTFLRTEETYTDFDFRFEMKFDDLTGNSGMMFRGMQKPGDDGRVFGYQCEHDNRKDRAWTAGLYDEARRGWLCPKNGDKNAEAAFTQQGKMLFKWNDWNEIRILCEGKRLRIWLNGEQRVDLTDDSPSFTEEGFFALQVHGGPSCNVRWRNIRIREL